MWSISLSPPHLLPCWDAPALPPSCLPAARVSAGAMPAFASVELMLSLLGGLLLIPPAAAFLFWWVEGLVPSLPAPPGAAGAPCLGQVFPQSWVPQAGMVVVVVWQVLRSCCQAPPDPSCSCPPVLVGRGTCPICAGCSRGSEISLSGPQSWVPQAGPGDAGGMKEPHLPTPCQKPTFNCFQIRLGNVTLRFAWSHYLFLN